MDRLLSHVGVRLVRLAGVLALVATCLVLPLGASPASPRTTKATSAKLILAGWFGSTVPVTNFVRDNIEFLKTQPFDGLVVYLRRDESNPAGSTNVTVDAMNGGTSVSYSTAMSVMAPLVGLSWGGLQDNLALIHSLKLSSVFGNWDTIIQNMRNVARAAKDSGLKGLCFDNEDYEAPHWNDWAGGSPDLAATQSQARLRGRELMDAMLEEFPDMVLLTLHGPYISTQKSYEAGFQFPNWWFANEVLGPFFVGTMESVVAATEGSPTTIDGGELYDIRTEGDFIGSANWRRHDLASESVDCPYIPETLRPDWAAHTSIGFGLMDKPPPGTNTPMDSNIMRSALTEALEAADRYVWLYTEARTFLLPPGTGNGASQAWIDAVRDARTAAGVGEATPLGTPAGLNGHATSTTAIHLAWEDRSTAEDEFSIERQQGGGAWSEIDTVGAGVTSYDDTGLTAGTPYSYRVRAVNATGASPYSNVANVSTPPTSGAPAAPSNLILESVTSSTASLSWTDNSDTEQGFAIEMLSDGTWSNAGTVGADQTTFTKTGLSANTAYSFRVLAFNAAGDSTPSNTVSGTTSAPHMIPAAPSNLTLGTVTSSTVALSWTDESFNENGFSIELLTGGVWSQTGWVPEDVTTFTKSGLAASTSYSFRVVAFNASGNSSPTNVVNATTTASSGVPAAPSNLTVTGVSETTISIAWTDNSNNEGGFNIQRQIDGVWSHYDWRGTDVTTFTTGGLPANATRIFRVVAFNGAGNSPPSNSVTATTSGGSSGTPTPPSNLVVVSVTSTSVKLSWTDNSANENGFSIERLNGGNWAQTGWVPEDTTTFTKTGLQPSTPYSFRVLAFNGFGNSATTNEVNATTSATPTVPTSPSNLDLAFSTTSTLTLTWTDNSSTENGFSIEKMAAGGTWSQTGWVPANTTTFTKSGLPAGTWFDYRVVAFNGGGNSPPSNVLHAQTRATGSATAPSNLIVTGTTSSSVSLSWTDNSSNENGFNVEKMSGGGGWTPAGTVTTGSSTEVSGLSPNTMYSFRVYAFNGAGNSWYTNVATATTSP